MRTGPVKLRMLVLRTMFVQKPLRSRLDQFSVREIPVKKLIELFILLFFCGFAISDENTRYDNFMNKLYSEIDELALGGIESEALREISELKDEHRGLRSIAVFIKKQEGMLHFLSVSFSGNPIPLPKINYSDRNRINVTSANNMILVESPINRRVIYRVSFVQ